jgi:hypothetical protein
MFGSGAVPSIRDISTHGMHRLQVISQVESELERWLIASKVPTIAELLLAGNFKSGEFFTHHGLFIGRGISDSACRFQRGKPISVLPTIRADLRSFRSKTSLQIQVHPENYTSVSVPGELSGRHRLIVLGRLTDVSDRTVRAQAYAVGVLHERVRGRGTSEDRFERLQWHMEMFVDCIDSFSQVGNVRPATSTQLARLRHVPEHEVKSAFASIAGEPFVTADWGGERSDLCTTQLRVEGQRVSAAFAFKGPAKFRPLTVADLGKNGDQSSRLFSEPADLVIVQHCHLITSAVRDHHSLGAIAAVLFDRWKRHRPNPARLREGRIRPTAKTAGLSTSGRVGCLGSRCLRSSGTRWPRTSAAMRYVCTCGVMAVSKTSVFCICILRVRSGRAAHVGA